MRNGLAKPWFKGIYLAIMAQNEISLAIRDQVLEAFPEVHVFALRAVISDQSILLPALQKAWSAVEASIDGLADIGPITTLDDVARWRSAYGKLGIKPSKFPSSIEALLRRASKGRLAETGLPAVDLYNAAVSAEEEVAGAFNVELREYRAANK